MPIYPIYAGEDIRSGVGWATVRVYELLLERPEQGTPRPCERECTAPSPSTPCGLAGPTPPEGH